MARLPQTPDHSPPTSATLARALTVHPSGVFDAPILRSFRCAVSLFILGSYAVLRGGYLYWIAGGFGAQGIFASNLSSWTSTPDGYAGFRCAVALNHLKAPTPFIAADDIPTAISAGCGQLGSSSPHRTQTSIPASAARFSSFNHYAVLRGGNVWNCNCLDPLGSGLFVNQPSTANYTNNGIGFRCAVVPALIATPFFAAVPPGAGTLVSHLPMIGR